MPHYLLDGAGAALIAVAATNKPHLRQRKNPITVHEKREDGTVTFRIPIAQTGVFRHPLGDIHFTQDIFQQMVKNHEDEVTDFSVHLDLRHKDQEGALAWLDVKDGGWLAVEGDWLVGYGVATDEEAVRLIEKKRYRFASAEFTTDYRSNLKKKLSTDDMEEVTDPMSKKTITVNGVTIELEVAEGVATAPEATIDSLATQVAKLASDLAEAQKKLKETEDALKVAQEKAVPAAEEEDLPAPVKARLEAVEAENARLRLERDQEKVERTITAARSRVKDGKSLAESILTRARSAMLLESNGTVKLENPGDAASVIRYFREQIATLLEEMEGTVPVQTRSEGEGDTPPPDKTTTLETPSEEDMKPFREGFWN